MLICHFGGAGGRWHLYQVNFSQDLLRQFARDILAAYPRKTFGYFFGPENEVDHRVVTRYRIFEDDARSTAKVDEYFTSNGAYYRNNANAGFLATPEETMRLERWRRAERLAKVGAFHTHLRHPAFLAGIDRRLHPTANLFLLLISLRNPAHPEIAVWAPAGGRFESCDVFEGGRLVAARGGASYFPRLAADVAERVPVPPPGLNFVRVGDLRIADSPVTNRAFAHVFPRFAYSSAAAESPVTGVSYHDAEAFCVATGTRLLTEPEWGAACAGVHTRDAVSHHDEGLSRYAVYSETSNNSIMSVRSREANAHGLYDMQGNVWEWCKRDDVKDAGHAPTKGGSYLAFAEMCDSTISQRIPLHYRAPDLGFRVCFDDHQGKAC